MNTKETDVSYQEIITGLRSLSEMELQSLNFAVCDQLKQIRNTEAARKRFLFKTGDKVSFNGRRGYKVGTIMRVKRKKAIVNVTGGGNWDVPLNMLSAVEV